ncbi:hypothetical protein ACROYT_G025101 [Oculina patagonica]
MSSIVTAVFKATIGLLVNKGRDKAAEKLKDGDVTDQKFRGLIVREIDDIKSKLDGLSRKDLLASISFFKEGIELLYEVFYKARSRGEYGAVTTQAACAEAFSVVKGVRKLDLTELDESATRALFDAKERFKQARIEATRAFSNEALKTSDRILAMQYRVMATILEKVDHPADAVAPCRVCIEELHCVSAVQQCFSIELTKGFWAQFAKGERREIISNVCHLRFVIYRLTLMVCFGNKELSNWPCIGSGEDKVDPLRDERVTEVLRKQGMEHCCVTWSFGQEGGEEHKLKMPRGIATNSSGQFIVGDYRDGNVKVFDSTGTFMSLFSLPKDDVHTKLYVLDVATDVNDSIYVLARLEKPGAEYEYVVYEFNNTADLHHKFPVRGGRWARLTVTDSGKVLVLRYDDGVDVHETDGQFVGSFGEELKGALDITAANDGRVMVVDTYDSCVYIFSEHGDHLNKFKLQGSYWSPRIAFHRASGHVVLAGIKPKERGKDLLQVEVYTKDGEFVRGTQIYEEWIGGVEGITVTTEGRIAVTCVDKKKVLVI